MSALTHDDFIYAMESTRVIYEPDRRIDTFGSTSFDFHLISELMDSVNQVRVREGRIEADRPRILRPEGYEDISFEGFGEQAEAFRSWFRQHAADISFLQYGFNIVKNDISETLVHDQVEAVCDRVISEVHASGNPVRAVIYGVDDTWEISLVKFTLDMVQKSQDINVFDFQRRGLLPKRNPGGDH